MKLKLAPIVAITGLIAALSSCAPKTQCEGIWIADTPNPGFFSEVDSVNKTMSLQISSMVPGLIQGFQGEVYQSYFTGDFNVVVPFSNFACGPLVAGDGNPYGEIIMYNSEVPDTVLDTTFVKAGISRDYIYAAIGNNKVKKTRLSTTTSGTMRIQKIGNSMLAQIIAGNDTAFKQMGYPFTPVRFALRLGSFGDSTVSTQTAIKFKSFNVSGTTGATLFSDEFKCNSIYIP